MHMCILVLQQYLAWLPFRWGLNIWLKNVKKEQESKYYKKESEYDQETADQPTAPEEESQNIYSNKTSVRHENKQPALSSSSR